MRRLRAALHFGVWLGALVAVLALLPYGRPGTPVVGYVEAQRFVLAAPLDGRLATVAVDVHQDVQAGQVLARLDEEELQLRLSRARLELEAMESELRGRELELEHEARAAEVKQQLDAAVELRRRQSAVELARLDELRTQADIQETRIRLQGLDVEAERLVALERQGIASDAELLRTRTERDALQKRIAELSVLLDEQRARVEAARGRTAELGAVTAAGALPPDAVLEPLRWRVKAQQANLERIAFEASKLDLVASATGRVELVHQRPGQWIAAGTPLITIVDPAARRILAYLPENLRDRLAPASMVHVQRPRRPGKRRTAKVQSVSPAVVMVPQRLWRDPRQEEWAWEIVLPTEGDEAPGERVDLVFGS